MSTQLIAIRQSGGANIVSLPKSIVQTLGLSVGSKLNLTLEDNRIVLTPSRRRLNSGPIVGGQY